MKRSFGKYVIVFLVAYSVVFVLVLLAGKLGGFSYREPISLSWSDLFSYYLQELLFVPLIFGVIGVYIQWDNDRK